LEFALALGEQEDEMVEGKDGIMARRDGGGVGSDVAQQFCLQPWCWAAC
jgi:hypothetical protein